MRLSALVPERIKSTDPWIATILVVILVGVLVWVAFYVLDHFPIAEPFNRIARVLVVVAAVLYVVFRIANQLGISL